MKVNQRVSDELAQTIEEEVAAAAVFSIGL